MPNPSQQAHWTRTRRLMLVMLGLWLVFSFAVEIAAAPLNRIVVPYLGLPLGLFVAAPASLIAFLLMLVGYARRQDRIDREHGFDEEA